MNTDTRNDKAIFDAYVSLREIAQNYQLEKKLIIPRVVFVGETSSGKSMLVQNFLRFPCAFSQHDIGTRCPVLYRLRYNPKLADDIIHVKEPAGVNRAEDLADHLRGVMQKIQHEKGFSSDEYLVEIESNQYRDFEILDVPGLISGSHDDQRSKSVEEITERYARNPAVLIVQLKEASQLPVNSYGTKRIRDFCLTDPAPCGSPLPPRHDYENFTITIQTKFDKFMDGEKDGSKVNEHMKNLVEHFKERTLFTSMIFDRYDFGKNTYDTNRQYIADLSDLESNRADQWIDEMNQLTQQSSYTYGDFDKKRFRPLIGINVVRDFIQDMWVKAFRSALPKIQQVLYELVQKEKLRYNTLRRVVEEKDLEIIRSNYQDYIDAFRSTLTNYVAYRAEITSQFEFDIYSRTYKQIEEEYNRWSRKYQLTWSAYQTADQLINKPIDKRIYSLTSRYIGARHFERIRQVFFYMILTYQPPNREQDWFETTQSLLYGITADGENLEKSVRELLFVYIRETFVIGICWLTQMYSFLIDHFEQHITSVLLSPDSKFAHLAIGHAKFLSYVRLEYHRTTREFIRRAVKATKHARYAKKEYVSHSICHYLRILVESFPRNIKNNSEKHENPLTDKDPLRLIFDSGNFLPENRNPLTGNYLPATGNVVYELFTTVRGLLLHDITTNFFANVVTNLHRYDSMPIRNALRDRIIKMSNKQLAHMSHIDLGDSLNELEIVYEKLKTLEQAYDDIEHYSRLFDGKITDKSHEKKQQTKNIFNDKRDLEHQAIMNKLQDGSIKKNEDYNINANSNDEEFNDYDKDEYELRILDNDPDICQKYLVTAFQRDDLDDLNCGFLKGDDFNINKKKKVPENQKTSSTPISIKKPNPTTNPSLIQPSPKNDLSAHSIDASTGILPSTSDYISSLDSLNESPKPKHQSAITKLMDKVTSKKEEKPPKSDKQNK